MTTDREGRAARALGPSLYSAELGMAICQRMAAGESLMAICRDPAMPHRTTVHKWALAKPDFGVMLASAQRARRLLLRRRDRAFELARRARPTPAKGGQPSTYTPEVGEEICWRLIHGESLLSIGRDPEMPCPGTVYRWVKRHDDFEEMYRDARTMQADYLFDETREVAVAATVETVSVDRLRFDIARWQTSRLAPKKYMDRLQAADERAAQEAAEKAEATAARVEKAIAGGFQRVLVTSFERSPKDPKVVIAYPPRDAEEAARYEAHFGEPYSGPGPMSAQDDWRYLEAHRARRRALLKELGVEDV